MLSTATLSQLRGQRVCVVTRAETGQAKIYGVLKGVNTKTIWLGDVPIDLDLAVSVEAAPLVCSSCHREANRLFADDGWPILINVPGLCAECYRKLAARRPPVQEPCEVCGGPGVRNPGTDQFLCTRHHAQSGSHLVLHGGANAVLAECATEDVSSPKHVWASVRGARFRCIRCRSVEKHDPELLKSLRGMGQSDR